MTKPIIPVPADELMLTTHLLFCNCSLWPEFPECLSHRKVADMICVHCAQQCELNTNPKVCCKLEVDSFCGDRDKLGSLRGCQLCLTTFSAVSCCCCEESMVRSCGFPKTCCKCAAQQLCVDCRMALPPD
eukprot:RCo000606